MFLFAQPCIDQSSIDVDPTMQTYVNVNLLVVIKKSTQVGVVIHSTAGYNFTKSVQPVRCTIAQAGGTLIYLKKLALPQSNYY